MRSFAVALVAVALLGACGPFEARPTTPPASSSPAAATEPAASPTASFPATAAGTAIPTVSAAPCVNSYPGASPVWGPETRLRDLQWSLDSVTDFYGVEPESRWSVRFFVPSDATGEVTIAITAVLEGPAGPIRIIRYAVGAPGAQPRPATQPIVLRPCRLDAPAGSPDRGLTILYVYAPPIDSGRYSLSVPGISLPVGAAGARFDVTLTCVRDTQAASASCR